MSGRRFSGGFGSRSGGAATLTFGQSSSASASASASASSASASGARGHGQHAPDRLATLQTLV